jgi:hypothetical protein
MRKLDLSPITTTIGMPLKSGSLIHLQNAYTEALAALGYALVGSDAAAVNVYVLTGCVNTGSGSTYNISSGAVLYNNEIFQVPAASFTAPAGQTAVANIVTSYFSASNADGVQFTDGVVRNVHQIRQIVISAGLSGSGAADFSAFQLVNTNQPELNLTATGQAVKSGTYPNINIDVPEPAASGILAMDKVAVGDIAGGGTTMTIVFRTPIATSNYIVLGSFISNGTHLIDSAVEWAWYTPTTAGFDVQFSETASGVQNVTFCYVVIAFA